MNVFQSLLGSFGGASNSRSVLGIDIGSSSIKVIQLRREKGKAILETYGEIALGPYSKTEVGRATHLSPTELAQALKDLMKEANVTATDSGVAIPFSASLTAIIEMPKMEESQLSRMIPLEARKYIPANMSDVMLDWFIIPDDPAQEEWKRSKAAEYEAHKNDAPKTEVLLVAIHKEVINNFQEIARQIGVDVGFYELEIFGAARSSISHGIAPMMVVDIGSATTKVYVVESGIIRFSHLINLGAQDLTLNISRSFGWGFDKSERVKREQGMLIREGDDKESDSQVKEALLSTSGRIFSEINRVVLSYEKRYGRNISRIVLVGGGAELLGLKEYVADTVRMDVEMGDPFSKVQTPEFLKEILTTVGPEFAVSVGVALRKMQE